MKTFREFLEQIYTIEEGTRKELLSRMSSAYNSRQNPKRKTIEGNAILSTLRAGKGGKGEKIISRLNNISKIYASSEGRARVKRRRIIQDLKQYYPETDYQKAKKKAKKLADMDTHHITPLHYSAKLKASMTPEEWRDRVRKDAESGVYHGHHHKNLMGAVTDKTPEHRARRGIRHGIGGAHELERQTKDLTSIRGISHKDLLTAAHRIRIRNEKSKGINT